MPRTQTYAEDRPLTEKQAAILCFIISEVKANGLSPSYREIGEYFQISISAAKEHCILIARKGYIDLEGQNGRAIRLQEKA